MLMTFLSFLSASPEPRYCLPVPGLFHLQPGLLLAVQSACCGHF